MQHKGVVQPFVRAKARLAANMVIFFMDLRGLREARLLFVHRLGNENARIVFVEIQQQRRGVGHHINKLLVAYPRGVKQNVVAKVADFIHHLTRIVDSAVIGAQLNDRQAERTRIIGFLRCGFTNLLAQVAFVKAVLINATDETERVTRRFQIDRRRASLNQRAVVVRFVVVAVEQHQIAAGQQRIGHHLIGGGSAVQHKVGFIGVEHLRGKLLRVLG